MSMPTLEMQRFSVAVHVGESVQHDYLGIHPALLEAKGVIPKDWEAEIHQHGAGFLIVGYTNGFQLFGDVDSLTVSERQVSRLGVERKAIGLVQGYLKEIAPHIFQRAFLSWAFQFTVENNSEWFHERFVSPKLTLKRWKEVHVLPVIMLVSEEYNLIARFPSTEGVNQITVECEIHAPMTTEGEMLKWLSRYIEHEEAMLCGLNSFMEVNCADTN